MKVYDAGLKSGDGLYLFKTYCSLLGRPLYAESNSKHISLALCQTNVRLSVRLSCHRPELRQKCKSHSEITDISKSLTPSQHASAGLPLAELGKSTVGCR